MKQAGAELRQFLLLAGNFWRRFFENEMLSRQADMGLGLPHILALVALPGIVVPFLLKLKYIGLAALPEELIPPYTWDDKLFFVSYSMTMIGLLGIVVWDNLLLDKRDFAILSSVPVRTRTVCLAKLAAVLFFPAVFLTSIVHFTPLLMASFLLSVPTMTEPGRYIVAHALAVLAAGAFTFFSVAGLLAMLVNLFGYRLFRQVSGTIQFSITWIILSFTTLYPKALAGFDPSQGVEHSVARLFPPMWFLGLFEVLLGRSEAGFHQLAAVAVHALVIVGGTALLGTLAMYVFRIAELREHQELPGNHSERKPVAFVKSLLNQHLLRHPLERATFHFMRQTLLRSPRHRLILIGYAGVGFAFAVDGVFALFSGWSNVAKAGMAPLLSVQLILSFFLISGMRFVFTLPAEVRSNWIFRLTETETSRHYFSGVRKVLLLGLLPCWLLMPACTFLLGWGSATIHLLYGLACSLLLMELLLIDFHKIPFTCTYLPGKAHLLTRWVVYWFAFSIYGYQLAILEDWALRSFWRVSPLITLLLMLVAVLRWWNRRQLGASSLVFEEQPETLCVLNLNEQ